MQFYPEPAPVPGELRTEDFVALPLSPVYAVLDHAAYVASPDTIRIH